MSIFFFVFEHIEDILGFDLMTYISVFILRYYSNSVRPKIIVKYILYPTFQKFYGSV